MRSRNRRKSWKTRRKTQYRLAGTRSESNQHVTLVEDWLDAWHLKEHFEEYDIPYREEEIRETYSWWSELRGEWYKGSKVIAYRYTWWQ